MSQIQKRVHNWDREIHTPLRTKAYDAVYEQRSGKYPYIQDIPYIEEAHALLLSSFLDRTSLFTTHLHIIFFTFLFSAYRVTHCLFQTVGRWWVALNKTIDNFKRGSLSIDFLSGVKENLVQFLLNLRHNTLEYWILVHMSTEFQYTWVLSSSTLEYWISIQFLLNLMNDLIGFAEVLAGYFLYMLTQQWVLRWGNIIPAHTPA